MRTHLECIPCIFRQALDAARLAGADEPAQKRIFDELCKVIPGFSLAASPLEIDRAMFRLVRRITGNNDPYKAIKENNNQFARSLYPKLQGRMKRAADKLLTAIEIAIAGNIIDYGVKNSLDVDREIKRVFAEEEDIVKRENKELFDYQSFQKGLERAEEILYLADNAGEAAFDKILIEELVEKRGKRVIYAVKGEPIINDALMEDAIACGVDEHAQIISSGSDAPGTALKYCSPEFIRIYEGAEMIISKGQGNYEALSEENRPIFFLFKVKCPVIARDIKGKLGDVVLKSALEGEDDR